jgi:uncharacterized protein (UPF0216 family)
MGQTTDQIENHIENKREDLKSYLQELETRVKSATDWRHYFQSHTLGRREQSMKSWKPGIPSGVLW